MCDEDVVIINRVLTLECYGRLSVIAFDSDSSRIFVLRSSQCVGCYSGRCLCHVALIW